MKFVEIRTQAIWYNGEGKNTNVCGPDCEAYFMHDIRVGL